MQKYELRGSILDVDFSKAYLEDQQFGGKTDAGHLLFDRFWKSEESTRSCLRSTGNL